MQIEPPNSGSCLSPSCDGASENGSESSSVDSSSKICRSHCIHSKKTCLYYKPASSYRSASANGRRTVSPNNIDRNNRNIPRASPIPKYDAGRYKNNSSHNNNSNNGSNSPVSRVRNVEMRNRTVRSLSSSRCRTQNEDSKKWSLDSRFPIKSKPPCCSSSSSTSSNCSNNNNNNNNCDNNSNNNHYNNIDSDKSYATMPRHSSSKYRCGGDSNGRNDNGGRGSREPSLNRAANLRKKFVENNLMTTSLTVPSCSNSSSPVTPRTSSASAAAANTSCKISKTKIYHEITTQTSLTNDDLNQIIAGVPTKVITDNHPIDHIIYPLLY